jgi:formylmethanofuran:tetrahydromethanopterin formyltransferase
MQHTEKTNQQPRLMIAGGGKTYQVQLNILTEFLDNCQAKHLVEDRSDIENNISDIADFVIDGMDDKKVAAALKRSLQFLRELDLLFKGLIFEERISNAS